MCSGPTRSLSVRPSLSPIAFRSLSCIVCVLLNLSGGFLVCSGCLLFPVLRSSIHRSLAYRSTFRRAWLPLRPDVNAADRATVSLLASGVSSVLRGDASRADISYRQLS